MQRSYASLAFHVVHGAIDENKSISGGCMEKSSENQKDESRNDVQGVSGKEPAERDEAIPVSDETQGNRANEKLEERGHKKQETHEEAKSITGSEAHRDVTNAHPGEGPAPLDRY
jgi:hypothetical protein